MSVLNEVAPLRIAVLLTALMTAPAALAATPAPAGRYAVDVDATYQALVEAKAATETSRDQLERQKDLIFLEFGAETLSFVAGPQLGGGVKGSCRWRLEQDRIRVDSCRQPDGRPFSVKGQIGFEADSGTVTLTGNTPVPVRYHAQ
ncbi:hypothetical protein [Zavarzinia aquatilis]|uniref:hypothetical protein n=1 Tax=Zavarzinia aquatilis TaxID=2211142 RepID=UPI001A9C3859|nr:hypothetical protein [Zavarzinia aquatilis]